MINPDPFTILQEEEVQRQIELGRKLLGDTTPGKLICLSTQRGEETWGPYIRRGDWFVLNPEWQRERAGGDTKI